MTRLGADLLVATVAGRAHDVVRWVYEIVGDGLEIAFLLERPSLYVVASQPLAQHDDAIIAMAGHRSIVKLGDHLLEQVDRLEPTFSNDLGFDPFGLGPWRGLDRMPRGAFQE